MWIPRGMSDRSNGGVPGPAERAPVERAFRLVNALLREPTLTVRQAADAIGVDVPRARTIMEKLVEEVDCAEYAPGSPRRVRLRGLRYGEPSHEAAIAACLAASLAPLFEGSELERGMREGLRHVVDSSPRPAKFQHIARKFFFVRRGGEMALPENAKLLERLAKATLDQSYVKIAYENFESEIREEVVEPLSLAVYDHQLYLLARRENDRLPLILRFSRIRAVTRRSRTFEYPSELEYSPRELFAHSIGNFVKPAEVPAELVVVRLSQRLAVHARTHRWHASQHVESVVGGVIVQLTVRICPQVESWILSFGDQAEVLEPLSLRERIAERVRRQAALYARPE